MKDFKVGDKVVRTECNWLDMVAGDEDTVVGVGYSPSGFKEVELEEYGKGHSPSSLRLVGNEEHIHCDLIIKWAKGAKIQFKLGNVWCKTSHPSWSPETEYRVEPEYDIDELVDQLAQIESVIGLHIEQIITSTSEKNKLMEERKEIQELIWSL